MRSRAFREGSVGLFLLLGFIVFGGIVFWLRGGKLKDGNYLITVQFDNAGGLREGAQVRYRGVEVGKIIQLKPGSNGVDVIMEIEGDLKIPREVEIRTSRYGLLGEANIDISPQTDLSPQAEQINPLSSDCQAENTILCNEEIVQGKASADLIASLTRLSELYSDPDLFNNINDAAKNIATVGAKAGKLTDELSAFTRDVKKDITKFSQTSDDITRTANTATEEIAKLGNEFSAAANQINSLAANLNELIDENESNFNQVLVDIIDTSEQLSAILTETESIVTEISSTLEAVEAEAIAENLESLSNNLLVFSEELKKPANLTALQQTLDSARVTFANTAKITSDLDELTGNAEFRNNVKRLVDGLSKLVSSTDYLDRQIEIVQILEIAREMSQENQQENQQKLNYSLTQIEEELTLK